MMQSIKKITFKCFMLFVLHSNILLNLFSLLHLIHTMRLYFKF